MLSHDGELVGQDVMKDMCGCFEQGRLSTEAFPFEIVTKEDKPDWAKMVELDSELNSVVITVRQGEQCCKFLQRRSYFLTCMYTGIC